jgi:hypothetical protein
MEFVPEFAHVAAILLPVTKPVTHFLEAFFAALAQFLATFLTLFKSHLLAILSHLRAIVPVQPASAPPSQFMHLGGNRGRAQQQRSADNNNGDWVHDGVSLIIKLPFSISVTPLGRKSKP